MTTPVNGALVSPLHNHHSFPLMVPQPFFIPNFLQSAKFLAENAKRTQSGGEVAGSHGALGPQLPGPDFSSLFGVKPPGAGRSDPHG